MDSPRLVNPAGPGAQVSLHSGLHSSAGYIKYNDFILMRFKELVK